MGLDPRPAHGRRDPGHAEAGRRRNGCRRRRSFHRARLHPQPLCRCPRDRRALRADRPGEMACTSPTCGATDRCAPSACARSTISPGRPACRRTSRITTARRISCCPLIDEGRALGLDLTYDTYPYLAASTILGMVALPPWVQEGGIDATVERLQDPSDPHPAEIGMVRERHALCPREHHDRDGGQSRLALGRGPDRHRGGRRGRPRSRRLRLRNPVGLGNGRGHRGVSSRRSDRGRRPCDPASSCAHGGL